MQRSHNMQIATVGIVLIAACMTVVSPASAQTTVSTNGAVASSTDVVFVTNADFKKFRPSLKFSPKEAGVAVLMSPREAGDYTAFIGKELGKDFYWKKAPEKDGGYLIAGTQGLGLEALPPVEWPPVAPEGMVYVPERPFIMGTEKGDVDEKPQRLEATGPYFIDKLEVSNAEFKAVFPEFVFPEGQDNLPAIVNWKQAADYAGKLKKRLPTEAEWEKAARGYKGTIYPWGNTFDPTKVCADDKAPRGSAGAASASPYGCFDMSGSAWEWTADWYQPYAGNDSPSDDYGETCKVLRGGSTGVDIAALRCSIRFYLPPDTTGGFRTGFRCAKDIE